MSDAVITSYTLIDSPIESDLRENGMVKFYITRVFNKEGKFTVSNWLEYKDADSYKACEDVWAKFMTEKASKSGLIGKVAPHRCVVQYDYS